MSTACEVLPVPAAPPSPPSSSSAPRRIACDRCHGQKLKCPRDVNGGGPCTRCAKAGAICLVSPARATGRPAKNPKPQHRKSESSVSLNSMRPSLTDTASTIDDDIVLPPAHGLSSIHNGRISPSVDYFATQGMQGLPMTHENSKFYTTSDMPFDFVDIADTQYASSLGFEYDDGTNFMSFATALPPMMSSTFPQDSPVTMNFACQPAQVGVMPPPPTPSLPTPEMGSDGRSGFEESQLEDQTSRSSSLVCGYSMRDFGASMESLSKQPLPRSSYSPSLKRGHTVSEDSFSDVNFTATLPIRTVPGDESASKKRRFSTLPTNTPDQEEVWSSNLSYSQALSTIQFEVDSFSKTLMSQTLESSKIDSVNTDVVVDIGVLLPISDKFMALVPQVCQQYTSPSRPTATKPRTSSFKHFLKPSLERSQTEPDLTTIEGAVTESKSIDSGLVQLIFACQTRLHFAFSVALDVISHNFTTASASSTTPNHPSSSIGSYTLPNSSSLSTLLHIHAISHSLERLDITLTKYLGTTAAPSAGFFEGIFCKQKRNQMAVWAFKERAFEEAGERKNALMSRIREIVADVAGNDL